MTPILLLVFIVGVKGEAITTGLTTTAGSDLSKDTIGPIEESVTKASRQRVANFARKYGVAVKENEKDVTNEKYFVRPCNLTNINCIRKFFANHSCCTPCRKSVDPLYLPQSTGFLSFTNATINFENVTITGLGKAKICEFYYNKKTRNVVLAIQVPRLKETTPEVSYTYRRTARESITLSDYETVTFRDIIFTAIIPKLPNLRLDLAEIHAYAPEGNPNFVIGPKAYTSDDPDVMAAYQELLVSVPTLVREFFLFQSQLFTAYYIQRQICDFGLELYSL